jgi:hypothetical protein
MPSPIIKGPYSWPRSCATLALPRVTPPFSWEHDVVLKVTLGLFYSQIFISSYIQAYESALDTERIEVHLASRVH